MIRELLGREVVVKTLDGRLVRGKIIRIEPTVAGTRFVVQAGPIVLMKVRPDQIVEE